LYDVAVVTGAHVSATWVFPAVAASPVGAAGAGATGVALSGADAADCAVPLVATTVHVYDVPLTSPESVRLVPDCVDTSVAPR